MPVYRWRIELDGRRHQVLVEFGLVRGPIGLWVNGRELDTHALRHGRRQTAFMLGGHACILSAQFPGGSQSVPTLMVDGRLIPQTLESERDLLLRPAEGDSRGADLLRAVETSSIAGQEDLLRASSPTDSSNSFADTNTKEN